MLAVNGEVLKVITILLVVGTVIFSLWSVVLFHAKNRKWKDMAGVALFSLIGAAITPLADILNDVSFLVRLGLSTIIVVLYAFHRYKKSKQMA
jgi:uncharacterized membrane protein YfcA